MSTWAAYGDYMARVTIAGTDGRELGLVVNGRQNSSRVMSNGSVTFWIVLTTPIADAEFSFRYLDGAEEETETLTGAEWEAIINPG